MNRWIALSLFVATAVAAQQRAADAADCEDAYLECKEDCLIKWGGTTDLKKRAKNNQCINKCAGVDRDCREAFLETKRNNLDEGSLKGSPSSRDVDSEGMPTKTAAKKPPPPKEDDVRDDAPPKKEEKPVAQKPEIAPEETPKSTRSTLKTDPKEKPAEVKPEPKPEPPKKEEPPPRREDPPKREEPKAEEAPPPKKEKREEKRDEPTKEKKRALDEWDPDAF